MHQHRIHDAARGVIVRSFAALICLFASACGDAHTGADAGAGTHAPATGANAGQGTSGPTAAQGLAADQVLRAGVFWGSCVPDDGIARYIRSVYEGQSVLPLDLKRVVSCLAAKRDGCAAIEACTPLQILNDGPCKASCSGDTFSACDDAWHFIVDCAGVGLACKDDVGCVDPELESCDESSYLASCESGRPKYCADGVKTGPACATFGLSCEADGPSALCRGSNESCTAWATTPDQVRFEGTACDGNVLEACANGGMTRLDCGSVGSGLSCQHIPLSEIDCKAPDGNSACEASPPHDMYFCGLGHDCVETRAIACEGTSVVVCNMGKRERVDCKSLGFTGCAEPFGCVPNGFTK